ncbi:GrpB family protein [Myroides sp. WP-1]|uniref:GrpB family protein n=1 Tax=Myroides sp. WP-1 TaxID=2759944 RepID=UPI0015FD247D|nr:GrpB family protein [Myroides sp. WP-1]MBB1139086.1 GrpB family protein [Myroides sp. WP-1]
MILPFEPYTPQWKTQFNSIQTGLFDSLQTLTLTIEHIGSTAVEGLSAKPIIDVLVGVQGEAELDLVPPLVKGQNYVYYEKYNEEMPYRRFFVLLKEAPATLGLPERVGLGEDIPERLNDHHLRLAHIHVIPIHSENWIRHIAFRDYLRTHPEVRAAYQALKEQLVQQQWKTGNDYNEGKDQFLKREEEKAVNWYTNN